MTEAEGHRFRKALVRCVESINSGRDAAAVVAMLAGGVASIAVSAPDAARREGILEFFAGQLQQALRNFDSRAPLH